MCFKRLRLYDVCSCRLATKGVCVWMGVCDTAWVLVYVTAHGSLAVRDVRSSSDNRQLLFSKVIVSAVAQYLTLLLLLLRDYKLLRTLLAVLAPMTECCQVTLWSSQPCQGHSLSPQLCPFALLSLSQSPPSPKFVG